jgi:hypothetical protein
VILWWEALRLPFNIALGASYVSGMVALAILAALYDDNYFPEPVAVVVWAVVLGVFGNVCYTAGWVVELLLRWRWPRFAALLAPLSFVIGCGLLLLIPWLFPAAAAIGQTGCESSLTAADAPGAYQMEGMPYSYTLRVRGDGSYVETWVMGDGAAHDNAGTWRFSPERREPRVILDGATISPFRFSSGQDLSPDRRATVGLGLERCWGRTALRLHTADEVFRLVKTDD